MVTLIDGTEVDSASEAWRMECEARQVLRMPTLTVRQEYLATIAKRRGEPASDQLKQKILQIWQRNKNQ